MFYYQSIDLDHQTYTYPVTTARYRLNQSATMCQITTTSYLCNHISAALYECSQYKKLSTAFTLSRMSVMPCGKLVENKKSTNFLCKKCHAKMQQSEAARKGEWRAENENTKEEDGCCAVM